MELQTTVPRYPKLPEKPTYRQVAAFNNLTDHLDTAASLKDTVQKELFQRLPERPETEDIRWKEAPLAASHLLKPLAFLGLSTALLGGLAGIGPFALGVGVLSGAALAADIALEKSGYYIEKAGGIDLDQSGKPEEFYSVKNRVLSGPWHLHQNIEHLEMTTPAGEPPVFGVGRYNGDIYRDKTPITQRVQFRESEVASSFPIQERSPLNLEKRKEWVKVGTLPLKRDETDLGVVEKMNGTPDSPLRPKMESLVGEVRQELANILALDEGAHDYRSDERRTVVVDRPDVKGELESPGGSPESLSMVVRRTDTPHPRTFTYRRSDNGDEEFAIHPEFGASRRVRVNNREQTMTLFRDQFYGS